MNCMAENVLHMSEDWLGKADFEKKKSDFERKICLNIRFASYS